MIGALAALVAFVAAGVGAIVMVRRRPADPVTQFRRQIDALSAESRRTVITQRSESAPAGVQTIDASAPVIADTPPDATGPNGSDTDQGAPFDPSAADTEPQSTSGATDGT